MLGYLSLDIICSSSLTVFLKLLKLISKLWWILFHILQDTYHWLQMLYNISIPLIANVMWEHSLFSEKTESKTKKRKVDANDSVKSDFEGQNDTNNSKDDDELSKEDDVDPLAEGWEASTILGATDVEGQVHFLIQWWVEHVIYSNVRCSGGWCHKVVCKISGWLILFYNKTVYYVMKSPLYPRSLFPLIGGSGDERPWKVPIWSQKILNFQLNCTCLAFKCMTN